MPEEGEGNPASMGDDMEREQLPIGETPEGQTGQASSGEIPTTPDSISPVSPESQPESSAESEYSRLQAELRKTRKKLAEEAEKGGATGLTAEAYLRQLEFLDQIAEAQANTAFYDQATFELAELQTPEVFRLPTPARMYERLSDEERGTIGRGEYNYSNDKYKNDVEKWMEDRIRTLESIEQHFEEQPQAYQALVNATFHFSHRTETRTLGRRMKENLDKRRIIRRMVRIREEAGVQGFSDVSSALKFEHLIHAFSYERISGDVEREFQNYERMGRILARRRDLFGNLDPDSQEGKDLKKEIDVKERYIIDYFKHGGVVEDKGLETAYALGGRDNSEDFFFRLGKEIPDYERDYLIDRQINVLEDGVSDEAKRRERSIVAKYKKINEKQKRGLPISDEERLSDEETKLLKLLEFRNKEWATKYTGGLYSLTGRAAAQGMRLGGLGDFYLERLLNIQRWFKGHRGLRRTEGIWKGVGKFEGNPFDMGLRDPLTDMLKEAEDENLQYLQGLGLNNVDFIKVKDEVGEEINKIDKIISLEHVKIGSKDLWQELLDKRLKTYEGVVGVNADYEAKAEVTRKVALLPYLLNPTDEKLIALQDYFEHMGTGEEKVGFTRKNGELVAGKTEKVSGIETKHIELGERTLEWMRADKNAPESIEALKYSKLQEYLNLIDLMSKEELISNERRDFLYKEYLGTSIKTWAQTKTQVDQMVGFIFRNPETRALNISNFLSNLLKRLFGYVFQEEAR